MTTRRLLVASALLVAAASCKPSIDQVAPPAAVTSAVFDPLHSQLPLPNDLAISAQGLAGLPEGAQKDLLQAFAAAGGFPNDQEVAITIPFVRNAINADGTTTPSVPELDLGSFTDDTFFVYGITASGQGQVELDPLQASDYAGGVLTVHHQGHQPWAPGQYFVFLRGGAHGVRTSAGEPVEASQTFSLVAQGQNMLTEQNLSILRALAGDTAGAQALAEQLNTLIFGCPDPTATSCAPGGGYQLPFAVADTRFPHQELAVLSTFAVAPAVTQVELDPGRGLVPLPIDLLRDPRPVGSCPTCGHITAQGACGLAGGTFDAATGTCSSPAAAGFQSLDGFGTTAPLLVSMSDLILAPTVTTAPTASATFLLYDLTDPTAPALVDPATYVTEPVEFTSSGLSPVVAIQPSGASAADATSPFRTRPLKENTMYAVVISDGVLDKTGKAIGPGTVAKILKFTHPLVDGSGHSQLAGIDDATAGALEVMRQQLIPVLATANADAGITTAHVAMAYTFKTQSIRDVALQLTAAPYAIEKAANQAIFAVTGYAPHTAPTPPVATPNVAAFFDITFNSIDAIDKTTGALRPTLAADLADPAVLATLLTPVQGYVAIPKAANVPLCSSPPYPAGARCAKVVVVGHGLHGSKDTLLAVADSLAAQGLIAVATDLPLHGSRAWCQVGSTGQCGGGGTCTAIPGAAGQGDAIPPGICTTAPVPEISGQYFISANFFRTRDTIRQNLIDESALILAMARPPASAPYDWPQPATDARTAMLAAAPGVIIDPSAVSYTGTSLGGMAGASVVATNPRLTRAVLNAGGATMTDVFTTSPRYAPDTDLLLASLGIGVGTPQYLQFLAVAKTVLDPADPANFAGHLTADTWPDLLTPAPAQAAKAILSQANLCDDHVPNPWNYLMASTAGTGPLPGFPGFGTGTGTFQLYVKGAPPASIDGAITACGSPSGSSPYAVPHTAYEDWADATMTSAIQSSGAAFLSPGTLPPTLVDLP
jgi:hypothetical protein